MARSYDGEVPLIEGHDDPGVEPLGERDHRCIGSAERQIRVTVDERGDALPVGRRRRLDLDLPDPPQKAGLGRRPETAA
ncbi:MAG: hypothetical protein KJ006_10480 [Thermoleophilia bacterium]|nr:hypothetical protein [Thermoleophilia bacterium]